MNIKLRHEKPSDHSAVEHITREAFWNLHAPGCNEHYLVTVLRSADCFIAELNYVAVVDEKIVGNIMYTKAKVLGDDGEQRQVICFGPVSVLPKYQGMGIGTKLIEHTKNIARDLGYTAIIIYGSPDYYHRVGFVPARNYGICTSQNMYLPALQALELVEGALKDCAGMFVEDSVYELDEKASEEFDKKFPHKEKVAGLPSQKNFAKEVSQAVARE